MEAVAALLSSARRETVVLTATVLLVGASLVGWWLGTGMVERGYQTVQNSELITEWMEKVNNPLMNEKKGGQTPQNIEMFVVYLNALAPAVNNLEVLPGRQVDNFSLISEAALTHNVTLEDFALSETKEKRLIIFARAANMEDMENFAEQLRMDKTFSLIDAPALIETNASSVGQQYTIACTFSPLF